MPAAREVRINLVADVANLISPLRKASSELERQFAKMAKSLDGLEKNLEQAGSKLTLKVTAPLAALAVASIKAADTNKDFADSMQRMSLQAQQALAPLGRALIDTFETFQPTIERGIRYINGLATAFEELDPATKEQIILFGALAASIGPAMLATSGIITTAKIAASTMKGVAAAAGNLLAIMPQLAVGAAAVGVAFASWEFGTHIYSEFKIVQQAGAVWVRGWQLLWNNASYIAEVAFTYIRSGITDVFEWIARQIGTMVVETQRLQQALLSYLPDSTLTRTLIEVSKAIEGVGASIGDLGKKADATFDAQMLTPLLRAAETAKQLLGSAGEGLTIPAFSGDVPIDRLTELDASMMQLAERLRTAADPALQAMAEKIEERRNEVFEKIGTLPMGLELKIIRQQSETQSRILEESFSAAWDSIDREFAGAAGTKGDGFWGRYGDRMKADLASIRDTIVALPDGLGDTTLGKIKQLFESASELSKTLPLPAVVTERDKKTLEEATKLSEKLKALAESIRDKIDPTRVPMRELAEAERLKNMGLLTEDEFTKYAATIKKQIDEINKRGSDLAESLQSKLGKAVEGFGKTASDVFADWAFGAKVKIEDVAKSLAKMLLTITVNEQIFGPIFRELGGAVGSIGNAAGRSGQSGLGQSGLAPVTGGSGNYGYTPPPVSDIVGGFSSGLREPGGVSVEIIDMRGSGATPEVTRSTGPDGREQIKVMIRDAVKGALRDGSLDRTMGDVYGIKRRGLPR